MKKNFYHRKKDFFQAILLIILLTLYAYYETERKKEGSPVQHEVILPSPSGTDLLSVQIN